MKSEYPFIKLITPATLVGFRDEVAKKDYLHKIFTDAYKSPLSMLILGTFLSVHVNSRGIRSVSLSFCS